MQYELQQVGVQWSNVRVPAVSGDGECVGVGVGVGVGVYGSGVTCNWERW